MTNLSSFKMPEVVSLGNFSLRFDQFYLFLIRSFCWPADMNCETNADIQSVEILLNRGLKLKSFQGLHCEEMWPRDPQKPKFSVGEPHFRVN